MNKAKKYYVDNAGNMIGYPKSYRGDIPKTEVIPEPFHAKLKICNIGWLNSGAYFTLKDENGKRYNITQSMMQQYLQNHDVYIEGNWDFYSQGCVYSIGEMNQK